MLKFKKLLLPTLTALVLSTSVVAGPVSSGTGVIVDKHMVKTNPLAPGIIIKYKSAHKSQSLTESKIRALDIGKKYGINISFKRMMSGDAEVLSVDTGSAKQLSTSEVNDIVSKLNQRDDVEFAEVDAWMVPYLTPNDTAYNTQWHYHEAAGGMRLPAAWDTTTGSSTVTVAVLDTGYRPHVDLTGNIIGQYDMISDSTIGNDGNGRDANAQDPGDWTTGQCGEDSDSSWHGTHVAGTVAAVSNNNSFVAGVAWNVGLVPIRVLGTCGGSLSDIADGIRWAAGLNVSGVPTNANPAQVMNLSLGSRVPAACSATYQNAITAAFNAGTTIVVAAGNENSSAGYPPANCNNVISVTATNRNGGRAYYSNFGTAIDVAAPGGDACNPIGEGFPASSSDCEGNVWNESNMIQSTYNTGTTTPGADSIGAEQGTSMAAPHVAGLAALMYSIDINATPTEIENVLKSSVRSFPSVGSHQCTTAICGDGIVDANAAIAAMGAGSPPTDNVLTNGVAETGLSGPTGNQKAYTMVVPSGANSLAFTLTNMTGDGDLYIKFGSAPTPSNYDCRSWNSTGQDEVCNISTAQAGTYHVLVHAYVAYSGANLLGSYTSGGSQQSLFASTTNVNIPDNNLTGATSNISVNIPGNSGNVQINYNIVHTYRGDLQVVLTAPNGATAVLREPSGGGTNNLNESNTIDAGTTPANGSWGLTVIDNAEADTGHIDSWSIEFL
ncbi:MAG: S8 family serine peptidase [Proteobacteria bacterium]|nr:S8 family serine peptidase [Pseudomonadota bacterium]